MNKKISILLLIISFNVLSTTSFASTSACANVAYTACPTGSLESGNNSYFFDNKRKICCEKDNASGGTLIQPTQSAAACKSAICDV